MNSEKIFYDYLMSFNGVPYIWAGYNRDGLDCSGAVQIWLRALGLDPPKDQTSQALYDHFVKAENNVTWDQPCLGALSFYGKDSENIIHVGMCLNSLFMIEAGGGNNLCRNKTAARKINAEVRVRTITYRNDYLGFICPELPF